MSPSRSYDDERITAALRAYTEHHVPPTIDIGPIVRARLADRSWKGSPGMHGAEFPLEQDIPARNHLAASMIDDRRVAPPSVWWRLRAGVNIVITATALVVVALIATLLFGPIAGGPPVPTSTAANPASVIMAAPQQSARATSGTPVSTPARDCPAAVVTMREQCLVDALFASHADLHMLRDAHLYQTLNIARSSGGYTVTMLGAYADAARIAIVYSLGSATPLGPGEQLRPARYALSDAASAAHGFEYHTIAEAQSGEGDLGIFVQWFVPPLPLAPHAPLDLTLSLTVGRTRAANSSAPIIPTASAVAPQLEPPVSIVTPLILLPFQVISAPSTTLQLGQVSTVAEATVTLQQLVISPTEVRATLCLQSKGVRGRWQPTITFDGHVGERRGWLVEPVSDPSTSGCLYYGFPGNILGTLPSGPHMLSITEIELPASGMHIVGPWDFHFTSP